MSEINEGLDEILAYFRLLPVGEKHLDQARQRIKDLMCKHRGCEDEQTMGQRVRRGGLISSPKQDPCIHCGKEQP